MHYGGYAADVEALARLCDEHGLALIEDAAHTPSATPVGSDRKLGTFGLAGCFSFFSNKVLSCGEGGLLSTDDDGVAEQVRSLRSHAMTSGTWDRHRGHSAGYDVVGLGFNYRMDEPRAALLAARLEGLEDDIARRRSLVHRYRRAAGRRAGADRALPRRRGGHLLLLRDAGDARRRGDARAAAGQAARAARPDERPVPGHPRVHRVRGLRGGLAAARRAGRPHRAHAAAVPDPCRERPGPRGRARCARASPRSSASGRSPDEATARAHARASDRRRGCARLQRGGARGPLPRRDLRPGLPGRPLPRVGGGRRLHRRDGARGARACGDRPPARARERAAAG